VLVDRIAHLSGPIGLTRRKGEVDSTQVQRFAKALRHACEALLPHAGDPKTGSRSPNT
jgi:hypothetical protein